MVPVIGIEILKLTPFWNGVLLAAECVGGFLGAIFVSMFMPPRHYRRVFFWGSIVISLSIVFFSLSTNFYLSVLLLMLGGFGLAEFSTMQVTLIFLETNSEFGGRILGLLTVCIGFGPVGMFYVGYLAETLGTVTGLFIIGVEGLFILLVCSFIWPEMRKAPA